MSTMINCFKRKFFLKNSNNSSGLSPSSSSSSSQKSINKILVKYGKSKIKTLKDSSSDKQEESDSNNALCALILENVFFADQRRQTSDAELKNMRLLQALLDAKHIENVNHIKNFLDQTLLHFACESNNLPLCTFLIRNGANCLLEDNYRQTPLILAAKRNHLAILKLFVDSLKTTCQNETKITTTTTTTAREQQVRKACYYACCAGHLDTVDFLFKEFQLVSQDLTWTEESPQGATAFSELNVLHVACYKGNVAIVKYLLANASSSSSSSDSKFINGPLNEFRDCTPLEEAFKGYLAIDFDNEPVELYLPSQHQQQLRRRRNPRFEQERELRKRNYERIMDVLVERGARFSTNFTVNAGLTKLMYQMFSSGSGTKRHANLVHFLACCNHLFRYKLHEVFECGHVEERRYSYRCPSSASPSGGSGGTASLLERRHSNYSPPRKLESNDDDDDDDVDDARHLAASAVAAALKSPSDNNLCNSTNSGDGSSASAAGGGGGLGGGCGGNGVGDAQWARLPGALCDGASNYLYVSTLITTINTSAFDLNNSLEDFLAKMYACIGKVIKDYKPACVQLFAHLLGKLHAGTAQLRLDIEKLGYLKERNGELYARLKDTLARPRSLAALSCIATRSNMKCLSMRKVELLDIPESLKARVALGSLNKQETVISCENKNQQVLPASLPPFDNRISYFYFSNIY